MSWKPPSDLLPPNSVEKYFGDLRSASACLHIGKIDHTASSSYPKTPVQKVSLVKSTVAVATGTDSSNWPRPYHVLRSLTITLMVCGCGKPTAFSFESKLFSFFFSSKRMQSRTILCCCANVSGPGSINSQQWLVSSWASQPTSLSEPCWIRIGKNHLSCVLRRWALANRALFDGPRYPCWSWSIWMLIACSWIVNRRHTLAYGVFNGEMLLVFTQTSDRRLDHIS